MVSLHFPCSPEDDLAMPRWSSKVFSPARRVLGALFFLIFPAFTVSISAAPNYFAYVWQSENGLPQNAVTSVLQTRDGYIWSGTYGGLARFDGVHFTVFDNGNTPEMRSSRITSLFEAPDGTLWIGHERGEITCYRDGNFFTNSVNPKWSGRRINAILSDKAGDIWLVDSIGLLMRLKDGLELSPLGGTALGLVDVASNPKGDIWVGRDGMVSELRGDRLVPLSQSATNAGLVEGVCAANDGRFWMSIDGFLGKWDGQRLAGKQPVPWNSTPLTAMTDTRAGFIAAGTGNDGLYLLFRDGETMHFTRTNGLPSNWIESIFEDHEGDLWVGTGSGLAMLRATCISTISPPDLWQARPVLSVNACRDGSIWAGTEGAGAYRLKDGSWSHFDENAGISNPYVWSISEDLAGQVWLGTWGGGFFKQDGNHFTRAPGIDHGVNMPALMADGTNGFLIGTSTGLLHYDGIKAALLADRDQLGIADVRAIAKDRDGAVWFGTLGGGLGCLKNGRLRRWRKPDGLSSDFIQCLHFDSEGVLWIGTAGGGLNRLKQGHFEFYDKAKGLPDNVICDIEEDANGFFWISSHGGVIRVNKAGLDSYLDGGQSQIACQSYGMGDGLPTIECTGGLQPAGAKTADGRLWFPTSKGLAVINPENVGTNEAPPPVVIEKILIDDVAVAGAKNGRLQVLPGRHHFEFQYTGLSFIDPDKVRFKYRLKGWDAKWVDADRKRVAYYNYIPPGDYIFQVIACNNDGIWNETGACIKIKVLPYFWQSWWFRLLAGLMILILAGGIVWYDTRRRMRLKLEQVEQRHALENERSRIANDIHDDLGATLTRITMISESGKHGSRDPQESEADFRQIYETARELTRSMDEIVWAINPKHDTLESLTNYLQKFSQDFLGAAGIRCRLDVPFQIPEATVTAEARHNLFLAFKEALNNVVKHAAASEVLISMGPTGSQCFTLSTEDNGAGFDHESAEARPQNAPNRYASGNGLENMKRRLLKIEGHCKISSTLGNGTKIIFTIVLK